MRFRVLSLCAIALLACADDADPGTAPTATNLAYTPDHVPTGSLTTVQATLDFTDADGDVASVAFLLISPDGTRTAVTRAPLQGVGGTKAGTAAFAFVVAPPTAGAYAFEVWLSDKGGNDSPHLTGTLTAEAP